MVTRIFAILFSSILLVVGSFTLEASAADAIFICNDRSSRPIPGTPNFFKGFGDDDSEFIYVNQCEYVNNNYNTAQVWTGNYGSWRVRSAGGSYGSCQEGEYSNPGNFSSYYYKGYAKNGCKN